MARPLDHSSGRLHTQRNTKGGKEDHGKEKWQKPGISGSISRQMFPFQPALHCMHPPFPTCKSIFPLVRRNQGGREKKRIPRPCPLQQQDGKTQPFFKLESIDRSSSIRPPSSPRWTAIFAAPLPFPRKWSSICSPAKEGYMGSLERPYLLETSS